MRNYELINQIYAELLFSRSRDGYRGEIPDVTDTLIELIERERPDLKDVAETVQRETWKQIGAND